MSRRNRIRHLALFPLLWPAAAAAWATATPSAESAEPRGIAQSGDAGQGGEVEAVDERLVALAERLAAAQGGVERTEALRGFSFRYTPVVFREGAEPGAPREAVPGDTVDVSIHFAVGARRLRLTQKAGTEDLVRITDGSDTLVWVGGEARRSEQLAAEARAFAGELLVSLDLQWGLLNGQLQAEFAGERTRDGVRYATVRAHFPGARGVRDTYLLYLDPTTGLVARCDLFDGLTLQRRATVTFSDFVRSKDVHLPTRITFLDRERVPQNEWRLDGVEVDPDWPEGHFERP
jgi:hypothetical protein